jgi:hypothetical protein
MKLHSFIPSAILLAAATVLGVLHAATVSSGGLIKGSLPAVYYVGADGKRYVFPNDKTYFSWYKDFSGVNIVTDAELASYTIGGNVTYRPGSRLLKIQSDPKVYAVDDHGVLRWVATESAAIALYGSNWNKQVDDLSDSFFVNYTVGGNINSASDFSIAAAQQAAPSINDDKNLVAAAPVNSNTNTNTNAPPVSTSACSPDCALGNACVENACAAVPGPSAMTVKAFIIDTANVCFVGDACTGGSCCTVGDQQFADNANLKTILSADKYLYADKQQLCGRTNVSSSDKIRINQELDDFAAAVGTQTSNRMSASVSRVDLTGDLTLSRIPSSCSWWVSPDDLRGKLTGQVDSTTDAVFVIGSRSFGSVSISEPDSNTVDQSAGLNGAGYSYINKEWETDTTGAPDHAIYSAAFADQMSSSLELGISDPNKSYIGNHCRDAKRDFDETGVDCGGVDCNACAY